MLYIYDLFLNICIFSKTNRIGRKDNYGQISTHFGSGFGDNMKNME